MKAETEVEAPVGVLELSSSTVSVADALQEHFPPTDPEFLAVDHNPTTFSRALRHDFH